MRRLARDARGSTALEFALTFPVVLLFVFGLFAAFTLVMCNRAMEVGVEKALRYAIVHGGGGTAGVTNAYKTWAGLVWRDVGVRSLVTVTPAAFAVGDVVQVSVSYAWTAPASLKNPDANSIFNALTLTASGSMRVMN